MKSVFIRNTIYNEYQGDVSVEIRIAKKLLRAKVTKENLYAACKKHGIPDIWKSKIHNAMRDINEKNRQKRLG